MQIEIKGGKLPVSEVQEMIRLFCKMYDYEPSYDSNTGKITLTPKEPDHRSLDLFAGIDFSKIN